MNKRKLIYFLSAFVLIIGCYALNLSYSLFTQNISSENNMVDSSVPIINASLETTTFTVPANDSIVARLKIINSGTANIQYGISIINIPEGINAYLVEKKDNNIVGNLVSNTNKEVLIYLHNNNTEVSNVSFHLEAKYETINFDKDTFKNTSNIDCVNTVKLLNESILARATDTEITDAEKTVLDEGFDSGNITAISGVSERKLIKAEDDYGTSYIFRGAIKDNYVNFAGFTWRVVRINGDGTLRLILDGTLDKVTKDNVAVYTNGKLSAIDSDGLLQFNNLNNDNAYIGYMYGEFSGNSSTYDEAHSNEVNSTIKNYIDTFYEEYIQNYQIYLADTLFCGDKTLESEYSPTTAGFGNSIVNYSANKRLANETLATPTLKCAERESNTYSRYTSKIDENTTTTNGVNVNNDLKYPIALLSADEVIMAGSFNATMVESSLYYLYDAYYYDTPLMNEGWWTMTPILYNGEQAGVFYPTATLSLIANEVSTEFGVRPVINLKSSVIITGTGTDIDPYVIQ